jgi:MFS family permease
LVDGALTPLQRRQNLVAVSAAMAVTALIYGLSLPLLSLVMASRGISGTLIGLSAAVQSVGIALMAPFLPAYMSRLGPAVLMLGSILVSLVAFLLLPVFTSVGAWFVLRFVIGAAGGVLWICGDAWVNAVATERVRGRVVAIYGTAVGAGFWLGPFLLSVTGSDGVAPFLVSSAIILLSALPLLPVLRIAPRMHGERTGGIQRYFALAPVPMLMCLAYAFSEAIMFVFFALYGIEQGLTEKQSVYLIMFLGIGGMFGQFPIGWLADHMDRLLLASLCTLFVMLSAVAVPAVIAIPIWNSVLMLFLGAVATGVYTIGLVMVGEQFKGADLAGASALYGLMFGVGSILGPVIGGVAMESLPPYGVPLSVAVTYAIFLPVPVIALLRNRRR